MTPKKVSDFMTADTLGARLRRERRAREDPQPMVAALLEVSQASLSRYERGHIIPPPSTHRAIARYLGIGVDEVRRLVERQQLSERRAELLGEVSDVERRLAALSDDD